MASNTYTMNSHYIQHIVVESCIPLFKNLVLDLNKVQYTPWSTLFCDTARTHNLLHHIDPSLAAPILSDAVIILTKRDDVCPDALVLTWIYATISPCLLARLLTKNSTTAMHAWACLRNMCQQDAPVPKKRSRDGPRVRRTPRAPLSGHQKIYIVYTNKFLHLFIYLFVIELSVLVLKQCFLLCHCILI